MATMALCPPSPKSCRNKQGLKGSRQKEYRQVAGVSTRHFDKTSTKKHEPSLQKLTFCPRARWADAHRIKVNKIKVLLVSSIKITSPDRDDCDQLRDVRRSHSPVKLEPLGAGGLREPWWRCFFFQHVGLCVCACSPQQEEEREEKY